MISVQLVKKVCLIRMILLCIRIIFEHLGDKGERGPEGPQGEQGIQGLQVING